MTRSKEAAATSQPSQECCMCGDFGLSYELFRCKFCQFRFQHRYCSNMYPKAEEYSLCNWCLSQKGESGEKTKNSLISSSSNKSNNNTSGHQEDVRMMTKKKNNHGGLLKNNEKGTYGNLHDIKSSIKKQRLPDRSSPLLAARKRITTTTTGSDAMEEKLMMRRTKSEEISNVGKRIFRNKVKIRYKLLDEVSSQ